jgi:hypothetical protein
LEPLLRPLGGHKRLELQGNRPGEDRGRRIFFLSGVRVVGVSWRKPLLETTFRFEEVHRFALEALREPETIGPIVKRIFVHNVMAYQ